MDRDLAAKLDGLGKADLGALLSFMQSDVSRPWSGGIRELIKVNARIDAAESKSKKDQ